MDYSNYAILDFAKDTSFQDWVLKNNSDAGEFWEDFVKAHPDKTQAIRQARQFLLCLKFKEEYPSAELVESSLNETLDTITKEENKANGKIAYLRWIAAAAILIAAFGVGFFLFQKSTILSNAYLAQKNVVQDVLAGGNRATLTLANGTKLILDSAANGNLTNQENVNIIKVEDGQLAYQTFGNRTAQAYNTISTPRGGNYQLTLSDGTKVWLNAESSLRFPASFFGNERRVDLIGEAYFEVAKDTAKPFRIRIAQQGEVKVLGTHFNINSYKDESTVNTTLLEGSIEFSVNKFKKTGFKIKLVPGQQAELNKQGELTLHDNIDLEQVVAWKNGSFAFKNADLKTIMRQVMRWYDVEVVYAKNVPERTFTADISRAKNLNAMLKILELSNIHFKLEGKKITVMP